ncbi:hypothetical protein A2164_04330 [Candidatus Curtissbacteria bacterium RBG_13_35_7]|uniref:LytR/CpsA/Psr regulator C-terminal domain-containing protein n=1 Tax=Candidatus Curtissbacteria bacterium RBG_13_35_7 TaxID=1797705 RepID=A0A1F5G5U6_9BACT|nr:MAG: hypothetical protein A2164_04330 [Candidatus Curtissbacteria bacterium RBG_13_35_7]
MREIGWKKQQVRKKWRSLLSIIITITLLFAIVNGLSRGFSFKNKIEKGRWDGKSSFTVAVNSDNPSLIIIRPDPKKIAALALDAEVIYETGNWEKPLEKISEKIDSGEELAEALTKAYGVKVENFVMLGEKFKMDEEQLNKMFIKFASITTPLQLLTGGWKDGLENTNITLKDAFSLWWQLKGFRQNELVFMDVADYKEEIVNSNDSKVLGIDTVSLNKKASEYMENLLVINDKSNIRIINNTKYNSAGLLAASFIRSIGGNVIEIRNLQNGSDRTKVTVRNKNSYTAGYLANIFDCDINEAENLENEGEITLSIGSEFVKKYFE